MYAERFVAMLRRVFSVKGDSVWLFSLAGKLESIPMQRSGQATNAVVAQLFGVKPESEGIPPIPPGDANVAAGKDLFGRFCVACHGETGLGGHGEHAALRRGNAEGSRPGHRPPRRTLGALRSPARSVRGARVGPRPHAARLQVLKQRAGWGLPLAAGAGEVTNRLSVPTRLVSSAGAVGEASMVCTVLECPFIVTVMSYR